MLWLTALVEIRRQFSPFIYILVIIKINFSHLHRLKYLCGCSNLKYFICIATEIRTHTMTSDLSVSIGAVGSSHSTLTPDPYPFKEQSPSLSPPLPPFGASDLPRASQEPSFLGYPITQNGIATPSSPLLPSAHFQSEHHLPAAALASCPDCCCILSSATVLTVRLPSTATSNFSSTSPTFTWLPSLAAEIRTRSTLPTSS